MHFPIRARRHHVAQLLVVAYFVAFLLELDYQGYWANPPELIALPVAAGAAFGWLTAKAEPLIKRIWPDYPRE
jgi:hypothetical protein